MYYRQGNEFLRKIFARKNVKMFFNILTFSIFIYNGKY